MEDLKCPQCGSESIMTTKRSMFGAICVCRKCFHKGTEFKFAEAYDSAHDGELEYDNCIENGQYY